MRILCLNARHLDGFYLRAGVGHQLLGSGGELFVVFQESEDAAADYVLEFPGGLSVVVVGFHGYHLGIGFLSAFAVIGIEGDVRGEVRSLLVLALGGRQPVRIVGPFCFPAASRNLLFGIVGGERPRGLVCLLYTS